MPKLGVGVGLNLSVPRVGGGGAAPTTLPLSTPVIYINGDGPFNKSIYSTAWGYDGPNPPDGYGYSLRYNGFNWEWLYYNNNDEQITLSSNTANGSAIPLLGWSPSITITAPSVILVASTNRIIINDTATGINFTGTYYPENSTRYYKENDYNKLLFWDSNYWLLYDENESTYVVATPLANNINYIPTTGWPTQTFTAG